MKLRNVRIVCAILRVFRMLLKTKKLQKNNPMSYLSLIWKPEFCPFEPIQRESK